MTRMPVRQTGACRERRRWLPATAAALAVGVLTVAPAVAVTTGSSTSKVTPPAVLTVGQIARQDVPALSGSEPDTLVEPDVAASPLDPNVAVAVSHDGRYATGGAVGIETSWTHDGGRTWHHQPLPGITSATGGPSTWPRASDPVVAFDAAGAVYVSTLVISAGCDSAVLVSRSTNGGRTFTAPTTAHRSRTCTVSDDKNWLVVDTSPTSPHRGRIYQFWTPFLSDASSGASLGSPQWLVTSDDHGRTWTAPVPVSPRHANTQNSQPMIQPDGTIVDSYLDFGSNAADEGPEAAGFRGSAKQATPSPRAAAAVTRLLTRISRDGGRTWTTGGTITRDLGDGPTGIRCCLTSATADPVTGRLYAVWNAVDGSKVKLSGSSDGVAWSTPVLVNRPDAALTGVNADVSAYDGTVSVSYGLTNVGTSGGRFARQFVATSRSAGRDFGTPVALGPRSDYAYAAFARGIFPGDYIGTAMSRGRLYAVWALSSPPPTAGATYHQVIYGASLDVTGVVPATG